jgi:hypothetical protein
MILPLMWRLSIKYHERRLLACFLPLYTFSFLALLILSLTGTAITLPSILSFDLILSLSRTFIFSSAQAFIMKHLTHEIPGSSLFFNAAFTLGFSETLSNLTTSYYHTDTNLADDYSIRSVYLGVLVSLSCLVFVYYGELRIRYKLKINAAEGSYYKLLI